MNMEVTMEVDGEETQASKYLTKTSTTALEYFDDGQYAVALAQEEDIMEWRNKAMTMSHPESLSSRNRVIRCLIALGKFSRALNLADEVADHVGTLLNQQSSDPAPIHVVDYLINKGSICLCLGEFVEAETYSRRAEELSKEFQDDHAIYHFMAKGAVAQSLNGQGKYDKAMEIGLELITLTETRLGPEHPTTLYFRCHLSSYCYHWSIHQRHSKNHFVGHLAYAEKTLEAQKEYWGRRPNVVGDEHPDVLASMQIIASFYFHLGGKNKAREMIRKVVDIREKKFGSLHPDTLSSKRDEMVYLDRSNCDQARALGDELADFYQYSLGDKHPEFLSIKSSLADVYIDIYWTKMDDNAAIGMLEYIVNLHEQILGSDHAVTKQAKRRAEHCQTVVSLFTDYQKSFELFNRLTERRKGRVSLMWTRITSHDPILLRDEV
jgi:tetratricopeptide (TPR) repeat protein